MHSRGMFYEQWVLRVGRMEFIWMDQSRFVSYSSELKLIYEKQIRSLYPLEG